MKASLVFLNKKNTVLLNLIRSNEAKLTVEPAKVKNGSGWSKEYCSWFPPKALKVFFFFNV